MRFLCWHPESSCLFYSDTFDGGEGVEDVTGIEWAEKEMKRMTIEKDSKQRANPVAEVADKLSHFLWSEGYMRNCINCDMWRKETQTCDKFKVLPPAEVIVVGCKHHIDLIPF